MTATANPDPDEIRALLGTRKRNLKAIIGNRVYDTHECLYWISTDGDGNTILIPEEVPL